MYYVYIYIDPFTNIPFYVGVGKNNRLWFHLKDAKCKQHPTRGNKHKFYKIKQILNTGKEPIIYKLYENLSKEHALKLEIYLILLIGRIDLGTGSLTNLTNGGDFIINYKWTDEAKNKLSIKRKGCLNVMYNKHHTKESKEIMSIKSKNYYSKMTEDQLKTRLSILSKQWGHNHSDITKQKMSEAKTKNYILISPDKNIFKIKGLTKFASIYNLSIKMLTKYINQGKIPIAKQQNTIKAKNTVGWEIQLNDSNDLQFNLS